MFRFIFFLLIAVFIVRLINSSFRNSFKNTSQTKRDIDVQQSNSTKSKKVKKDVGEYVDYEEVK